MKQMTYAAIAAFTALTAIAAPTAAQSSPQGNWVVEQIGGAATGDRAITMRLEADGRYGGVDGCNRYSGPVRVRGASITFEPGMATRRYCGQERHARYTAFHHALGNATAWRVQGGRLVLLDAGGNVLMRLRR